LLHLESDQHAALGSYGSFLLLEKGREDERTETQGDSPPAVPYGNSWCYANLDAGKYPGGEVPGSVLAFLS
jgi:hypothetical protein